MRTRRNAISSGLLLATAALSTRLLAADTLPPTPGWFRARIGGLVVTALCDGTLELPVDEIFAKPDAVQLRTLLRRAQVPLKAPTSVNAFVVDDGHHVVMIDSGTGTSRMFGEGLGQVLANLRASGYAPEQIDAVYLTHMHTDHLGGLSGDGRAMFPRAVVRADAREAAHYLSRANLAAAGGDKEDFESAIATLQPYVDSGRLQTFDGRTALLAGVRAQPAAGHTPGHTVYAVESGGEKLLLWGDLMHVAAVQFPLPSATVNFDYAPRQSEAARLQVFRDAAREGAWIAAAHVGFPGIGKLRAEAGGAYSWLPITMLRGR